MITIITGGQTGVDRGAFYGALDAGFEVDGYMPKGRNDEHGAIPKDISGKLRQHTMTGYPARTYANLQMASALLIVVPDSDDPYATPGTRLTFIGARDRSLPRLIVDPETPFEHVERFFINNRRPNGTPTKLMVAGPRESRWANGQAEAASVIRRLGTSLKRATSESPTLRPR